MSYAAKNLSKPDATQVVAEICIAEVAR
jgi:hypothetical protein